VSSLIDYIVIMTMTPQIEIYTASGCGYCFRALQLLESKRLDFKQIDVSMSSALRAEMRGRAGGRHTVPQIFINGDHIGGCDDLFRLENSGHLDKLLRAS